MLDFLPKDLIREAPIGQIIRFASRNKLLQYPEEKEDFVVPTSYNDVLTEEKGSSRKSSTNTPPPEHDLEKKTTITHHTHDGVSSLHSHDVENGIGLRRTKTRDETIPYTEERLEVEAELALERTKTIPIVPQKTSDGNILVDWYTTDDPANPQNWSNLKRGFCVLIICAYTFSVYTGSAIYTSSEPQLAQVWNLTPQKASLPLSLYVLAYGLGPLIFAPLSEIPIVGRSPVYSVTFFLFVILSIPTALAKNFSSLLALRFLQGFFGSPCLANGGASMQDMYSLLYLPYLLALWVSAAYCGPALGPLLSGYAVTAKGWRWSLWEILWIAGPVLIVMFLFLPETSASNILLRRAKRLRNLTGDHRLQSQSEITQRGLKPTTILAEAMIKPFEITIKDPAVGFVTIYTAIVYGIYYSFFEVFPLVYPDMYGFNLGEMGVVFICIIISCMVGVAVYMAYLYFYLVPDILKNGLRAQESRLVPALFAVFGPPIGLFLFAWTANPKIHWIASVIGITIYGATVFVVFQCVFVYIPLSYPQYAASLFAANDACRSALACGSIHFARPLFANLGVARGVSLLAGLSCLGVAGMFVLYTFGATLRSKSKFAMS